MLCPLAFNCATFMCILDLADWRMDHTHHMIWTLFSKLQQGNDGQLLLVKVSDIWLYLWNNYCLSDHCRPSLMNFLSLHQNLAFSGLDEATNLLIWCANLNSKYKCLPVYQKMKNITLCSLQNDFRWLFRLIKGVAHGMHVCCNLRVYGPAWTYQMADD